MADMVEVRVQSNCEYYFIKYVETNAHDTIENMYVFQFGIFRFLFNEFGFENTL